MVPEVQLETTMGPMARTTPYLKGLTRSPGRKARAVTEELHKRSARIPCSLPAGRATLTAIPATPGSSHPDSAGTPFLAELAGQQHQAAAAALRTRRGREPTQQR